MLPNFSIGKPAQGWPKVIRNLALTCALLTGCGSTEPRGSTGDGGEIQDTMEVAPAISPPARPTDNPAGSAVGPDSSWITTVSYVGHGLRLSVGGVETLNIACVREPREMLVDVPGFNSIGSEERLSLGIDDEPYVFVAQVTPPPPAGVHATRSIDEEVLAALESASSISAFYGAQTSGPHAAPDPSILQDFLSGCRAAAAR